MNGQGVAMQPYFDDWASFVAMGGHGFYVWLCWGLVAMACFVGIGYANAERRRVIKQIKQHQRRQSAKQANSQTASK